MSQNSDYDNKLLNEYMDSFEKKETNNSQELNDTTVTSKQSYATCSDGTKTNDQIQSTWSYFENGNKQEGNQNGWNSQPF
ncbi:hypothetical protein BpHYR1_037509 [Brachionus plicatilis]|uniref:Uncharacterized protein n=1 Tax=Brachionus plicatilis TaxID=10195 RepID=A0A3M7PWW3_BRAPC|nr:hypothetical protein BpHYR1_037509 [Brachionus plicatilis]